MLDDDRKEDPQQTSNHNRNQVERPEVGIHGEAGLGNLERGGAETDAEQICEGGACDLLATVCGDWESAG